MTKDGAKVEVILDNYIPCRNRNGFTKPCFSASNSNELWVIMLEKAWAKLHHDYVKIIAGLSHETFRDMTGAPSWMHKSKVEGLWEKILNGEKRDYMMACGASADTQKEAELLEKNGII